MKRDISFSQGNVSSVVRYLNWSDDNDTVSGIAILDTTAIPEMRIAQCNFNVVQKSPVSEQTLSSSTRRL